MYQCKAGHLAVHKYFDKRKNDKKNKNPRMVYFSILKNVNVVLTGVAVTKKEQKRGLICMEMQGAVTIFAVNLKRIIKLMNEK